jgi:adenosylcobinamide-GDP ribazoletransferase
VNRIKNELNIFFSAVMFYTRIPVPKSIGFSGVNLSRATKYFPLIGILVGSVGALVFYLATFILSTQTSVLFSLIATILLTGAFHEDGFADSCDGLGGGYSKERILAIMKDSQIGTYGTIGLILLILTKIFLLAEINPTQIPIVIISAHAFSRLNPVLLMYSSQYVRNDDTSKSKDVAKDKPISVLIIAMIFSILPLFLMNYIVVLVVVVILSLILIYFRYYIYKKMGGYTGDLLGALQQISEVAFYVSVIVVEKLI